jgi:hypothetical protein
MTAAGVACFCELATAGVCVPPKEGTLTTEGGVVVVEVGTGICGAAVAVAEVECGSINRAGHSHYNRFDFAKVKGTAPGARNTPGALAVLPMI